MAVLDRVNDVIGELQTWSFSTVLSVTDGAGGSRHPLLSEFVAIELSVYLVEGATYTPITAWVFSAGTWAVGAELLKNVDIKNVGRGVYDETTGRLTVTLHAGDSPCIATGTAPGLTEMHEALIQARYNTSIDGFPKRVIYRVENLNEVPREP